MSDNDDIIRLIDQAFHEGEVDWIEAERSSSGHDRRELLRSLSEIWRISEFNRRRIMDADPAAASSAPGAATSSAPAPSTSSAPAAARPAEPTRPLPRRWGDLEIVRERPLIRATNVLHLNEPKRLWTWVADVFAVALAVLALTGIFILKGRTGITRRGAWLTAAGVAVPVVFLLLYT